MEYGPSFLVHVCDGNLVLSRFESRCLRRRRAPVLLPAEVYRELSPAINLRLSAFNDRLVELLKP